MLPSFARFMALWIKRLGRCLVAKHRSLHHQHEQDLIVYRNGHRNLLNRILHWVCIPMETATSLLVLDRLILLSRLSYQERGRNAPPLPRTFGNISFRAKWRKRSMGSWVWSPFSPLYHRPGIPGPVVPGRQHCSTRLWLCPTYPINSSSNRQTLFFVVGNMSWHSG